MASVKIWQPSVGLRHSASLVPISDASPDHPTAATTLPAVRSSVYSLPVKRRICPESEAS